MEKNCQESIDANILVHSAMADYYNVVEPHYKPESIARVTNIIKTLKETHNIEKVLDLGCGTGFMIDIVKPFCTEIVGVDVTQAMLDKVNKTGNTHIELIKSDTATVDLPVNYFDLATAYSFLDHLNDLVPTFRKCYESLKPGGTFYADLSPNFYFWEKIKSLDETKEYSEIVKRELDAIYSKDKEIEEKFGIDASTFVKAEYLKHVKGGFKEEELCSLLMEVGFKKVTFIYHWFIGQAHMINDQNSSKEENIKMASALHNNLEKALPVSRDLFKYIGFIAEK